MIDRIETAAGFRALRPEWDALYEASGESNLFRTWEWLKTWIEGLERRFVVLTSRPEVGAPLDAAVIFDAETPHRWCGVSSQSYRPGVLHRAGLRAPLRPFLAHAAVRAPSVHRVILHRSPDTPAFRDELARTLGPLRGFLIERGTYVSRIVGIPPSYDAYLAGRDKKVRQELRRKDRRLERELSGLELVELPRSAGGAGALDLVGRVEEDSWKLEADTAIVSDGHHRRFYADCFELDTPRTRGRLFSLDGPDGPIAFVIGVQHDDVLYALKTSYRADHARLSPGQVLFCRLIDRFCGDGAVSRIELLGVDQRWKKELATSARDERTFEILRPGLRGLAHVIDKNYARPALRAAAAADPRVARAITLAGRVHARLR